MHSDIEFQLFAFFKTRKHLILIQLIATKAKKYSQMFAEETGQT